MPRADSQFKPGVSGNKRGRPPLTSDERKAREMLGAASPLAVKVLIAAMKGDDAQLAVKAAEAVLRKVLPDGHQVDVTGDDRPLFGASAADIIAALKGKS